MKFLIIKYYFVVISTRLKLKPILTKKDQCQAALIMKQQQLC